MGSFDTFDNDAGDEGKIWNSSSARIRGYHGIDVTTSCVLPLP